MRDLERRHCAGDYGDPEHVDDRSGVTNRDETAPN
jgi:hypothetical protein